MTCIHEWSNLPKGLRSWPGPACSSFMCYLAGFGRELRDQFMTLPGPRAAWHPGMTTRCAPLSGGAELGQLSTDFNYMLQQIERQNSALAVARDSLELRVQARTEELQREVIERKRSEQQQRIAYAATRVLAESVNQESAIAEILHIICEGLGYEVAAIWKLDPQGDVLRCTHVWQRPGTALDAFAEATRNTQLPIGAGLPGRIWLSRNPEWIEEIAKDTNFPRAQVAMASGLRSGIGFHIFQMEEINGFLELYSRAVCKPDQDLLDLGAALGTQIGQYIVRKQAETELVRAKEAAELR